VIGDQRLPLSWAEKRFNMSLQKVRGHGHRRSFPVEPTLPALSLASPWSDFERPHCPRRWRGDVPSRHWSGSCLAFGKSAARSGESMVVETSQPLPIMAKASARWVQLGLGLTAMMAISSPQYVWTLFTKSFQDNLGATLPAVQITFSVVIVLQTWLSPLQGYFIDKFGPRLLIALGC